MLGVRAPARFCAPGSQFCAFSNGFVAAVTNAPPLSKSLDRLRAGNDHKSGEPLADKVFCFFDHTYSFPHSASSAAFITIASIRVP